MQLVHVPRIATPRSAKTNIATALGLSDALSSLPALADALALAENPLLRAIRANLSDPALGELRTRIAEVCCEDRCS